MSIFGIGVDICEIGRVEKSLSRHPQAFSQKILHPNEQIAFDAIRYQARFLAKRFAAKEAFAKALGTGIAAGVRLGDIEVKNEPSGKPYLTLHGEALKQLEKLNHPAVFLTISDEKRYAVAQVVIEFER